jgi:error-prone DNA polymerase
VARYAELQVMTNFSFLRGASHGEELVAQAKALGLEAIAITDRNTLAGVVRAHLAAKEVGLRLIGGARLDLQDGPSLLCLPRDRAAYGRLSRLISLGQMRAKKGECTLFLDDVARHAEGQIFIALAPEDWDWREASSATAEPEPPQGEKTKRAIRDLPCLRARISELTAARLPSRGKPIGFRPLPP